MDTNKKFKRQFFRWVSDRGIKLTWLSQKTGVPYSSLHNWKLDIQPLKDEHLKSLWIFTGKQLVEPVYKNHHYTYPG